MLTLILPHASAVRDGPIWVARGHRRGGGRGRLPAARPPHRGSDPRRPADRHALIIALANYYAGVGLLYPILFTWTALYAFYFFEPRLALAHMVTIGVAYAIVLAVQDPPSPITRWLLAIGTPLIAGMLISRMLGLLRDRKAESDEHERELVESERRTRLLLDSAPDAFVTLDSEGVIRSWNRAAEQMFGWSEAEAIGQTLRSLVTPDQFGDRHDERRRGLMESAERDGDGALRGRVPAPRRHALPRRGDRVEDRRPRRGAGRGLRHRPDRPPPPPGRAGGAPARAGRARRGGARGGDGQRHAAARGRRARPSHPRRRPVRPRHARARGARRRRRGDLPRRGPHAHPRGRHRRRGRRGGRALCPVRGRLRRPRGRAPRADPGPGPARERAAVPGAGGARASAR